MATDAITGSGYTDAAAGKSKSAASGAKLAKDMDTFLTLLTTQLKYQDPMSPMDSTEFTNQLVQFAGVEQGIQNNANLEKLIGIQTANSQAMAVGYLDNTVEAESAQLPLQDGKAKFTYALTNEASEVTVAVMDQAGRAVFSAVGETTPGKHAVEWDGTDAYGNQLPDGVYTINLTAMGTAEGAEVSTVSTVFGKVTGVSSRDGQTYLSMGDVEVALDKVQAVTAPVKPTTVVP